MSTIVSISSSTVLRRPLEPLKMSDSTTIKLSPLDKFNFPFTALLLYEHPINNAANTIKTALSQALVHYYPLSGRFVPGADGISSSTGPYIDCSGEGTAEFIAASADCSLKQAAKHFERSSADGGGTGARSLLDELIVSYPVGVYSATDPLLIVQLTEFTCGGFMLGVTWSHAVTDGAGIAQFLGAIGELARGLASPTITPIRWDEAVSSLPPPPAQSYPMLPGHCPQVFLDVIVPSSLISHIKSKAESHGQPRCTTFEVAAAVLWQCRTRATMSSTCSSPETVSVLGFAANVRKHVGAKDGYYGNCVVDQNVRATSGAVAGAEILDLVKIIRQGKDQVPDLLDVKRNESSKNQLQGLDGAYNMFVVTSWRNMGFEDIDFGSGPPARVMWHQPGIPPFPLCLLCPNKGEDGVSAVTLCVKEQHADAFLQEIAKFTI